MLTHICGVGRLLRGRQQVATARYDLAVARGVRASQFESGHLWIGIGVPVLITGFIELSLILSDGKHSLAVVIQDPVCEISHTRYTVYPAVASVVPSSWTDLHRGGFKAT